MLLVIVKIILGLFGLGIVVFVHELGHFLAARLVGIDVEAFSIGWGNPILKKKIGAVEYRLGMFPIGGYCKMKGDNDYNNEAYEKMANGIKPEEGSYHAASPLRRIIVCFGGPFFNLLFAVILLSLLWGIGFEINTLGNKIILASDINPDVIYPADEAGLRTGDRIIEISGKKTTYYHEIQENIALNPDRELPVLVERDGEILNFVVKPSLDKSSGAGRIGVYFWTDPVIDSVKEGSPAARAGLSPLDTIVSANGVPLSNTLDIAKVMEQKPDQLVLEYARAGDTGFARFSNDEYANGIGFSWAAVNYRVPELSFQEAVRKGVKESWKTLIVSIKSLRLLFMGIDLTQAVSGPARITYMIGEAATQGFQRGLGVGARSIAEFLALISVALCVMNLLPLPVLDGGMIILFFVELVRGKPPRPKTISVFQTCGMVIIFSLMIFALFGDIMFFVKN